MPQIWNSTSIWQMLEQSDTEKGMENVGKHISFIWKL